MGECLGEWHDLAPGTAGSVVFQHHVQSLILKSLPVISRFSFDDVFASMLVCLSTSRPGNETSTFAYIVWIWHEVTFSVCVWEYGDDPV